MNHLHEIVAKIVSTHFPELVGISISTAYTQLPDAYLEFTRNSRREYHIDVDRSLQRVDRPIVVGGIAHELAHVSLELKMNWFVSLLDQALYDFFSEYQTDDERKADLSVVRRGLGGELLAFVRYADSHRESYDNRDGLTREELERMVG